MIDGSEKCEWPCLTMSAENASRREREDEKLGIKANAKQLKHNKR